MRNGPEPRELNSQIEETRARMSSDVDALQDKVSPSAIIGRRKDATRNRLSSVKDRVMGAAHSAGDNLPSPSDAASGVQGSVNMRNTLETGESCIYGGELHLVPIVMGWTHFWKVYQ